MSSHGRPNIVPGQFRRAWEPLCRISWFFHFTHCWVCCVGTFYFHNRNLSHKPCDLWAPTQLPELFRKALLREKKRKEKKRKTLLFFLNSTMCLYTMISCFLLLWHNSCALTDQQKDTSAAETFSFYSVIAVSSSYTMQGERCGAEPDSQVAINWHWHLLRKPYFPNSNEAMWWWMGWVEADTCQTARLAGH